MTIDRIRRMATALCRARTIIQAERDTVLECGSDLDTEGDPIPGTADDMTAEVVAELDAVLAEIDEALA
ncbi:hypothetical protein [Blastochloris tepida]|uniref:Uncharacterized protein n=1 Tax=Blastochloris tepida TaxID=2233851 RepID=A0A348FYK0_9HYPH|nr:hypothetical protein [Blastochloris tepida]BBF92383.1 hypothetical protein BLTE_10680 [Blastochloris tepida]